jgi:hypothetical protein
MSGMRAGDVDVLVEADDNLLVAWRNVTALGPAPNVAEAGGLTMLSSGIPIPLFNPVYVTGTVTDPEAALAGARDHYAALGLPFVLVFREDTAPGLVTACEAAKMVEHWQMPLMVLDPIPEHGGGDPLPKGLEIVVVDDHNVAAYGGVLASAFGMPKEIVDSMFGSALVRTEGFTGLLGLLDGEPVATSGLFVSGTTAGVYNVATLEAARGKGIGAAITWAAALCGRAAGMERSVLQASEMGEPVYARMGYVTPVRYRQFEPS